jgi:hypothetical protein
MAKLQRHARRHSPASERDHRLANPDWNSQVRPPTPPFESLSFNAMTKKCHFGPDAESLILGILEATPVVIERVRARVPAGFPATVSDRVLAGLARSAKALEAMPPALGRPFCVVDARLHSVESPVTLQNASDHAYQCLSLGRGISMRQTLA